MGMQSGLLLTLPLLIHASELGGPQLPVAISPKVILTTSGIPAELTHHFKQLLREISAGDKPEIALIVTAAMLAPNSKEFCNRLDGSDQSVPSEAEISKPAPCTRSQIRALADQMNARVVPIDCASDSADYMEAALRGLQRWFHRCWSVNLDRILEGLG